MKRTHAHAVMTRERMLRTAKFLYEGGVVNVKWMMAEFGISWSAAKEDMKLIAMFLPVTIDKPRTWPGHDPRMTRLKIAIESMK